MAVLLLWGSILVLFFGGRMYTTDVVAEYEVAGSFVGQRPFLTASGEYGWTVSGSSPGVFVPHGVGYSLLLIPAAFAGGVLGPEAGKLATAVLNACFSICLVGFWYAAATRRFGRVPPLRMLALATGSMAMVYGKMPYDVTAAAAAAMAAFCCMDSDRPLLSGACMGLAVLIRADSILLLPVLWRGPAELKRFAVGFIPLLLLAAGANWYRFGSPLADGHSQDPAMAFAPFRGGIPGLFLSPGKGLLYYAPLCVLALFHQKDWRLWSPFVLSLVLHGMLLDWTGGTGWGPRFLFTSLPFLLLPLARPGAGGKLFWVVAAAGLVVSLAGCITDANAVEQSLGPDSFLNPGRQAVIWSFTSSPLFTAVRTAFSGIPDMFGASAASAAGLAPWLGAVAQSLTALLLGWTGIAILHRIRANGAPA